MTRRGLARPAGFTLVELLVVSVLMTGVCLMVTNMWRYFSLNMTDQAARARLAQELRFAVETISEDMGSAVGANRVSDSRVLICRDGPPDYDGVGWDQADTVVQYWLSDGKLYRHDQASGVEMVVAECVTGFAVEDVTPSLLQMTVQVGRSGITRQVTLRWNKL